MKKKKKKKKKKEIKKKKKKKKTWDEKTRMIRGYIGCTLWW